jgi:hypothetical protein
MRHLRRHQRLQLNLNTDHGQKKQHAMRWNFSLPVFQPEALNSFRQQVGPDLAGLYDKWHERHRVRCDEALARGTASLESKWTVTHGFDFAELAVKHPIWKTYFTSPSPARDSGTIERTSAACSS